MEPNYKGTSIYCRADFVVSSACSPVTVQLLQLRRDAGAHGGVPCTVPQLTYWSSTYLLIKLAILVFSVFYLLSFKSASIPPAFWDCVLTSGYRFVQSFCCGPSSATYIWF